MRDPSEGSGKDVRLVVVSFLFPALAGLLFGYDIGSTSGALLSLACVLGDDASGTCPYFDAGHGHEIFLSILTSTSLCAVPAMRRRG